MQLLGGRGPPGERVDQLVEIGRVLREEVAVLLHELLELLLRVLAPGVGVEHLVERGHHRPDAFELLRGGVLQRVAHALELGVEDLAAQQVLDLVVGLPGLGRAPLVFGELADGPRRVVRQGVELGLGQPGRVVRVGEQRAPLLLQRLVEQLLDLVERAVEAAAAAQLSGALPGPAAQRLEAVAPVRPPPQHPVEGRPR